MPIVGYSRASSFSPLSLSGLVAWYDASDTATITASGGAVSQWNDKYGTNHVTQGTAAWKPTTGTRTQNGKNVLDFDGNDYLSVAVTVSQPWTVYVFHASDDPGAGQYQFFGQYAGSMPTFYIEGNVYKLYAGSVVTSAIAETSAFRFAAAVANGASSKGYVDGSTFTGSAGATGLPGFNIGSFSGGLVGLDGVIGEVIVCSGAHSDATVAQVRTYAQAKWGTA